VVCFASRARRRVFHDEPTGQHAHRSFRLPARLPLDLRARRGGDRRAHRRPRPWRRGQRLYGRRHLRESRPLRGANPPPRPAEETAGAIGRERRGPLEGGELGGRAGPRGGEADRRGGEARLRDGVALFLCRHDGAGSARLDRAPAARQEVFRFLQLDLHQSRMDGLRHGHGPSCGSRSARDGQVRLRGDRWRRKSTW
jgi:hypothetical protein